MFVKEIGKSLELGSLIVKSIYHDFVSLDGESFHLL